VATKATTGANMPPRLSRMSSHSVLPLSAIMQTPIVVRLATNTARAGV